VTIKYLRLVSRHLPLLLWLVLIFTFSSRPDLPSPSDSVVNFFIKKSAHVIEFLVLTLLTQRSFQFKFSYYSILLPLFVAFTDETHQAFVPGRGSKLTDVLIDLIGISLGLLALNIKLKFNHDRHV
jgi:VanZ family protein